MIDGDREYLTALIDMSEQISLKCHAECDICFQLELCAAVRGMRNYLEGRMSGGQNAAGGYRQA